MSSETQFSLTHSGFWNALLPMGEPYVRSQNAKVERFESSIYSVVPADQRGAVNEGAFRIFEKAVNVSCDPSSLDADALDNLLRQATGYVAKLSKSGRGNDQITSQGKTEAVIIAKRLYRYFQQEHGKTIVRPAFAGCGWINAAQGDVLAGRTLYEIKAGQRHFRISDIRQLLCYCALDFSSKLFDIDKVALINPREGTVILENLDVLCRKISGTTTADVLEEIVNYMSEPISRYQAL